MKKRFDFELHRQDQFRTIASQQILLHLSKYAESHYGGNFLLYSVHRYIRMYQCTKREKDIRHRCYSIDYENL